jgi:hypothetical protein
MVQAARRHQRLYCQASIAIFSYFLLHRDPALAINAFRAASGRGARGQRSCHPDPENV